MFQRFLSEIHCLPHHSIPHILHVSGGSIGHLAPLVAVAQEVYKVNPNALQSFVCSDAASDEIFLKQETFDPVVLPRPGRNILAPFTLLRLYIKSVQLMKWSKPNIIFSKGGLISVPVCYAAKRLKIPIVLHESDTVMGKANTLIARWATRVCLGFPLTSATNTGDFKFVVTGNPLRSNIANGSREKGLKLTSLSGTKPILLIMGGSQGAESLNIFVRTHLDQLLQECDIIHLTGNGKGGTMSTQGYWPRESVFEDMPDLYACSTIALCRAGAGSISECAANKLPMILVPIEGLAQDHQVRNAEAAVKHGVAIMIKQATMNTELLPAIASLIQNKETYKTMQQKTVTFQHPEVSLRIAKILLETIAE